MILQLSLSLVAFRVHRACLTCFFFNRGCRSRVAVLHAPGCVPQDFLELLIVFNTKRVVAKVQAMAPAVGAAVAPRRVMKRRRGEQAQDEADAPIADAPQALAQPADAADAAAAGAVTMVTEPAADCDIKVIWSVLAICSAYLHRECSYRNRAIVKSCDLDLCCFLFPWV